MEIGGTIMEYKDIIAIKDFLKEIKTREYHEATVEIQTIHDARFIFTGTVTPTLSCGDFGTIVLNVGHTTEQGGVQNYMWWYIDLIRGKLNMVRGPISKVPELEKYDYPGALDLASIKITYKGGINDMDLTEYGLQWVHKETGEVYNHIHSDTQFFSIENWFWTNDDEEYDFDDIEVDEEDLEDE